MVRKELVEDIAYLGGVYASIQNDFEDTDYGYCLENFSVDLEASLFESFDKQQSPAGEPWQPLAASTVAKKGHSQILWEYGDTINSLGKGAPGNIYDLSDSGKEAILFFGSEDEKARFHQNGTGRIPQRQFVGVSEAMVDLLCNQAADYQVEQITGD